MQPAPASPGTPWLRNLATSTRPGSAREFADVAVAIHAATRLAPGAWLRAGLKGPHPARGLAPERPPARGPE